MIESAWLDAYEIFDSYGQVWALSSCPFRAAEIAAQLNGKDRDEPVMVRPVRVPLRHRRSSFYPWGF